MGDREHSQEGRNQASDHYFPALWMGFRPILLVFQGCCNDERWVRGKDYITEHFCPFSAPLQPSTEGIYQLMNCLILFAVLLALGSPSLASMVQTQMNFPVLLVLFGRQCKYTWPSANCDVNRLIRSLLQILKGTCFLLGVGGHSTPYRAEGLQTSSSDTDPEVWTWQFCAQSPAVCGSRARDRSEDYTRTTPIVACWNRVMVRIELGVFKMLAPPNLLF